MDEIEKKIIDHEHRLDAMEKELNSIAESLRNLERIFYRQHQTFRVLLWIFVTVLMPFVLILATYLINQI